MQPEVMTMHPSHGSRRVLLMFSVLLHVVALATTIAERQQQAAASSAGAPAWTVSGLSAGGFFAHQFHVAFSSKVSGAAIVAGGPYWCAGDSPITAQGACMQQPSRISVPLLAAITTSTALTGTIDPTSNLRNASVYLFSGSRDTTVVPGVVKKLEEYYQHWMQDGRLQTEYSIAAEHAWVTQDFGSSCGFLGSPYVNNCGYHMAYYALNHLASFEAWGPRLVNGSAYVNSSLTTFSQAPFVAGGVPQASGFDSVGYAYVPAACAADVSHCRLHISFHGCKQGRRFIGDIFAAHAGLLELAVRSQSN